MEKKSIIIIGAGIAGLSAGVYARMNGYDVKIFELHDKPGGLCTGWKRKGYTFDGCLHWLVGSSPRHQLYKIWQELGALKGKHVHDHDIFMSFEDRSNRVFNVYTDAKKLERHMIELSPQDKREIKALSKAVRRFSRFGATAGGNPFRAIGNTLVMLSAIPLFKMYGPLTLEALGARFLDPLIKKAFTQIFMYPEMPAIGLLFTLGFMHNKAAGFPQGGSLPFAHAIEERLLQLGGAVCYKSRVKKIVVKDNRAAGVELENGTIEHADVVISAADGHATLFDMLDNRFTTPELKTMYESQPIFQPIVQVSLGCDRDLSATPRSVRWELEKPIAIGGREFSSLWYNQYAFDPALAPAGKTSIVFIFPSSYAFWEKIGYNSPAYHAEKEKILATVLDELEKKLPGIKSQTEARDVATPFTTERYTGNWQGSMEGWLPTMEIMMKYRNGLPATLPGLDSFYMIGQWVRPGGGLPPAAMSAREAVNSICQADKKKFRTQPV